MIDSALFLAFLAAVSVLLLLPGPNVAVITANSLAYGPKYGLLAVAGTSSAMVVQLGLTALGIDEILGPLSVWLGRLRWLGVIYLVGLGLVQWRAAASHPTAAGPAPKSPGAIYLKALLVSLTNPKTLLFYAAFFPQFLSPARPLVPQLALLSGTFLGLAIVIDSSWALAASRVRRLLVTHVLIRQRLSGGILVVDGQALALTLTKKGFIPALEQMQNAALARPIHIPY